MAHAKHAHPDHPINALLAKRWSPYSFADKDVPTTDLLAILEAARWAPSSYNEQPWRYLLARRTEAREFEMLLSSIADGRYEKPTARPEALPSRDVRVFAATTDAVRFVLKRPGDQS